LRVKDIAFPYKRDIEDGFGSVYLRSALERNYPRAGRVWWGWQYVFPLSRLSKDPRTKERWRGGWKSVGTIQVNLVDIGRQPA
jgi:hypothetical protein